MFLIVELVLLMLVWYRKEPGSDGLPADVYKKGHMPLDCNQSRGPVQNPVQTW